MNYNRFNNYSNGYENSIYEGRDVMLGVFDVANVGRLPRMIDECVTRNHNGYFMYEGACFVVAPNNYGGKVRILCESGMDETCIDGEEASKCAVNEILGLGAGLDMWADARQVGRNIGAVGAGVKGFMQGGLSGAVNAVQIKRIANRLKDLVAWIYKVGTPQAANAAQGIAAAVNPIIQGAAANGNSNANANGNNGSMGNGNTTPNNNANANGGNLEESIRMDEVWGIRNVNRNVSTVGAAVQGLFQGGVNGAKMAGLAKRIEFLSNDLVKSLNSLGTPQALQAAAQVLKLAKSATQEAAKAEPQQGGQNTQQNGQNAQVQQNNGTQQGQGAMTKEQALQKIRQLGQQKGVTIPQNFANWRNILRQAGVPDNELQQLTAAINNRQTAAPQQQGQGQQPMQESIYRQAFGEKRYLESLNEDIEQAARYRWIRQQLYPNRMRKTI